MTGGPASTDTNCGFVALVGAPNTGKSTLVNALVGAKVSIVTHKVQTTRTRILGVAMSGASQIILIDTPGIFDPRKRLDRAMIAAAWQGASDADLVAVMVDAEAGLTRDTRRIIDRLGDRKRPAACILNKIDLIRRDRLLGLADELRSREFLTDFFMISALSGDGVEDLKYALADRLPAGPWLFPDDQLSDMNERLFAAEITREKLFLGLREELPYALTVETENWQRFDDGSVKIEQVIYVERDSQKGIVLGRGGERIKRIRAGAQEELSDALGCRTHLFLFVKVRGNWKEDPERYRTWGLDFHSR